MKSTLKIFVIILMSLIHIKALAQKDQEKSNEGIEIKDLEMPNAPALSLLDETSTNIDTPKNLQALTTTLMSSISNNNVGFEINPYMIFTKNKSFYNFYNLKWNKKDSTFVYQGWFKGIVKDLTISFAKVKKENSNFLSIGLRTNLIRIIGNEKEYVNKFNSLENKFIEITNNSIILLDQKDKINNYNFLIDTNDFTDEDVKNLFENSTKEDFNLISNNNKIQESDPEVKKAIEKTKISFAKLKAIEKNKQTNETLWDAISRYKDYKNLLEENNTKIEEFYSNEDSFIKEYALNLKLEDSINKPLMNLDLALAYCHFFENDNYSDGQMGKLGVWSTLNFNFKLPTKEKSNKYYLSLYGYARYLKDNSTLDKITNIYSNVDYFDLGGKAELQFYKLSFAYEYINRTKESDNYRSVGSIKYKYNTTITLNGGFGKNFEKSNNLVSFLGIHWGIESQNKFTTKNK